MVAVSRLLRQLRVRVARFALAVAVCQLAVLCSSTLVLATSHAPGASTVSTGEECSCDHTAGVMCPMHRKSSSRPVPANAPRWCTGADGSTWAVLPALGMLAMPEGIAQLLPSIVESRVAASAAAAPAPLDRPPDNPPPRA